MTPTTQDGELKKRLDYSAAAYYFIERCCHEEIQPARAWQCEITRWSFEIVRGVRPEVQAFSRLLIQYSQPDSAEPGQLRPDNMVVVHHEPIEPDDSYNVPFEPVSPFLVAEYGARHRKWGRERFEQYGQELHVPYFLILEADELSLFKLNETVYSTVHLNTTGRFAIPELELEAALLDGWVRFWFRDELLPLPGDLLKERDAEKKARMAAEKRATTAEKANQVAEKRATAAESELAKLREELAKAKGQG